ncbi:DUF2304 family protein [Oerskovia sp. M15]
MARLVGVEVPANLVFSSALVVLLVVCVQLSVGVSSLDERVRTLTEEIALLRLEVESARDFPLAAEPRRTTGRRPRTTPRLMEPGRTDHGQVRPSPHLHVT